MSRLVRIPNIERPKASDAIGEILSYPKRMDNHRDDASRDERLRSLVDRYERPLLSYARRMLDGDSQRAEDAVQETLLRLCQCDEEKITGHEAAWLFKVCRTRVIDMQRTKQPTSDDAVTTATIDSRPGPARIAEHEDQSAKMARSIEGLSPRQQEVLRLRLHGGLTYDQIAEVTGLERTGVGYHLHHAVRNLRMAMQESADS